VEALLAPRELHRRELLSVAGALVLVAAVVFGYHVVHGGLYSDDWGNAASYRFMASPRYLHSVSHNASILGSRPLLALLVPLPAALFGTSAAPMLLVGLLLGVLACALLYAFLRLIDLRPLDAGAITLLALLFPWGDSIRLWSAASLNSVALCFGLGGLCLAARAVSRPEGRAATRDHWFAVLLFVLSILTYEVMGVALLLTGVMYLWKTERRRALRWWGIDAGAVGAALLYTALTTNKQPTSLKDGIGQIPAFAKQSATLFTRSFGPDSLGAAERGVVLLLAAVVVVLLVRRHARRELALVACGAVVVGCAYVMFLQSYLHPLDAGINNRINLFAALGYAVLVYGVIAGIGRLAGRDDARRGGLVTLVLALVVAGGYVFRVAGDERAWDGAAAIQRAVLADVDTLSAKVPPGKTLVLYGVPAEVNGGPSVFDATWDLEGATRIRTDRHIAHAFPVSALAAVTCGPRELTLKLPTDVATSIPYGQLLVAAVPSGDHVLVSDRAGCLAAVKRFTPGPAQVAPGWRL
jgi:hypothetical protein